MNYEQSLIKWLVTISVFYQFVLTLDFEFLRLAIRCAGIFIFILILLYKLNMEVKLNEIFFSFLVCILMVSNVLVSEIDLSLAQVFLLVQVGLSVFLISISNTIKITNKTRRYIYFLILISIAYNLISLFNPNMYTFSSAGQRFLLLGYDNCNFTAIMLFFQLTLFLICSRENGNKVINSGVWIAMLYLIFLTGSRAVLLAAIFILAYYFFNFKFKIHNFFVVILCLFPAIFIFVYLNLYNSGMENIKILGKSLFSGRQYVYINFLSYIDTPIRFLFGNLKEAMFNNAHNAPLAFLTSIGLIGTISVYSVYISKLICANSCNLDKISSMSIIAILACFIHSCAESSGFLAGFPIITFMFLLYCLAFHSKN